MHVLHWNDELIQHIPTYVAFNVQINDFCKKKFNFAILRAYDWY